MKYGRILTAVVFLIALSGAVTAQDSHVESRYFKDVDKTVVTSDILYVVNQPTQFIQLQFTGRYPKQGRPTELPDQIRLEFYSYAPSPLYQQDSDHRFAVKADEQIFDFGLMSYSQANENGRGSFAGKKERLAIQAALPATALVRANKTPLTMEVMSIGNVRLADLTKLARAGKIVMRIGATVFALTPVQASIFREFVATITPEKADAAALAVPAVKAPEVSAEVPSDANKASLDVTLKWLKNEFARSGTANEPVVPKRLEPAEFKSCQINYRRVPLFRNSPVSNTLVYAIMEYQLNLADLNPEALSMTNHTEYSTVFLVTRNHEKKIRVFTRSNDHGFVGRTLDEKHFSTTAFSLSNAKAAAEVKVALLHAINLCQAQP